MKKLDLTGWKELDNTEVGTYLNDKKDSINVGVYDDAVDTRYSYETEVEGKARPDYFGKTEITGELKTIMRNPISSFGRGAWNNILGLGKGIAEDVINKGEFLAESVSYSVLPAGSERYQFNKRLEEGARHYSQKCQDWFAQYEVTIDERDRTIPTELGSVTGSLASSIGLMVMTKSPTLISAVFGSSASGEYGKELRDKGVDVAEAQAVATGLGAFQGVIERIGTEKFVENFGKKIVIDKLIANRVAKYLGKQAIAEGSEEVIQQLAEETVLNGLGYRDESLATSAKNVAKAGVYGAVGGIIGGGISLPFMIKSKENTKADLISKGVDEETANTLSENASYGDAKAINEIKEIYKNDLKNQLKDSGKTEEEINEFVDKLDFDNEDTQNEIADFLEKESGLDTLVGDTYEADVARFNEEASLDARLQAFEIKEDIKQKLSQTNATEEEQDFYSTMASNLTKVIYEKTGVTPAEQWEDMGLSIIDERLAEEVEAKEIAEQGTELTDDDLARMGYTEDDITRLEAEYDKEYYQLSKEMARLDEVNPEYTSETININGVDKTVYNSNGDRIAKSEQALQNFYNWFGDSKVVDEQGRPLVVYHGSEITDIEEFDNVQGRRAIFFTDKSDVAKTYSLKQGKNYQVYLKMSNPFIADAKGKSAYDLDIEFNGNVESDIDDLSYEIKKNGEYDGFIIKNIVDESGKTNIKAPAGTDYAVFNPNQIKSVSNKGTYSTESDNIYYQSAISNKTIEKAREVKQALQKIAQGDNEATVKNLRNDLEQYGGTSDVTFVYGDSKKGIHHIAERHGIRTLLKVFDAVIDGRISKYVENKKTIHVIKDGVEAILSLDEGGKKKTWLLTGYDTNISPDEEREFRATLKSTQTKPTFSRQDLGAELDTLNITPSNEDVNTTFYQDNIRGSFNANQNLIKLFKTADKDTFLHEFGHFFTINYVNMMNKYGHQEELKGIYDWLGVNNISEFNTEHWERLARGFETYVIEGKAPNIATQTLFQKMKKWLLDVYEDVMGTILKPEEINNDVREFFDRMFTSEEVNVADIEGLLAKTEDIKQVVSAMQRGEDVSFGGISKKDIYALERVLHARIPRQPNSLMDDLMSVGIDSQLAKAYDLKALMGLDDVKKGSGKANRKLLYKVKKVFPEKGGIKREDSMIDFLQNNGYLESFEVDTYEQKEKLWDKAIDLLSNANRVYSAENMEIKNRREDLLSAMNEADDILQNVGYDNLKNAIKTLKEKDIVAVDKNSLKYLKEKIKGITKDYKKIIKSLNKYRDTQESKDVLKKEISDYIKSQSLSAEHKLSLMNRLDNADTLPKLNKLVNNIYKQATSFYESEQKKIFVRSIKNELKKTKPTSAGQRYNYETNKLFVDIRKYDKMTKAEAQETLNALVDSEDIEENILRRDFLSYKSNGMESSVDMLEEVLSLIQKAKYLGEQAKSDKEFTDRINNEQARQDILVAIDKSNADKESLGTKIMNLYRRGFTNLYSMINSIANKELADKYQFETLVNDADKKIYRHTDNMIKTIMGVLNLKSKSDVLNTFAEMGQNITKLYNLEEGLNQKKYDLSRWDIIDIYLGMKNENTNNQFVKTYGEEQLNNILGLLTPKDIQIAEIMFNDIQPLYDEVNKVYIRQKGMDLLKVDNYWPRTSEHREDKDIFNDFKMQSTSPSFTKERATNVEPLPKNAWSKYLKHINESYYLTTVAEKQAELDKIWSSARVENAITNKFGKDVYNSLKKQIDAISLNGRREELDFVDTILGKAFNNFVVSKIALAPTVFVGQLTSITNYAEKVDSKSFYSNFAEGLRHPKQTISFMKKVAKDFLDSRYYGGFNETVSEILKETENLSKKRYNILSVGAKYNYTNALTSWVRMGDIGAIIFGGYAQIKSNIENGMSLDEAVKTFEFDTLRSQQSSNSASLSGFQRSKGLSRIVTAFKNTQHQYLRKMVDAGIQYQRGEISLEQASKIYLNYLAIQPVLYVLAKNLVKGSMGLLDDDELLTDGILEQLLLSWTDAIPLLTDTAHYIYRKATDQYTGNFIKVIGADDINKGVKKLAKENKTVYDWVDVITPMLEGISQLPVSRFKGIIKDYMEE